MKRIGLLVAVLSVGGVALATAKEATKENMTGQKEHRMANCPSAVQGATTKVVDTRDGVEVQVAAHDPAAQAEIRRRARVQQNVAGQPERGAIEHTGGGTGSGKYGYCPGLIQNTKLQIKDTPEGATLRVFATSKEDVPRLQQQTRARAAQLKK